MQSAIEGGLRDFESARLRLARASVEGGCSLVSAFQSTTELAADTIRVERCGIWLFIEERRAIRCFDLFERSSRRHSEGAVLTGEGLPHVLRSPRAAPRRPGGRREPGSRDEGAGRGLSGAARDRRDARCAALPERQGRRRGLPRARGGAAKLEVEGGRLRLVGVRLGGARDGGRCVAGRRGVAASARVAAGGAAQVGSTGSARVRRRPRLPQRTGRRDDPRRHPGA